MIRARNEHIERRALAIIGMLSKLRIPDVVKEDITARAYEDLQQELALALLEEGIDPLKEYDNTSRLLHILDRAVYRTARSLGWRKLRGGKWVYGDTPLFLEEDQE